MRKLLNRILTKIAMWCLRRAKWEFISIEPERESDEEH
jgi:hypothetical protein